MQSMHCSQSSRRDRLKSTLLEDLVYSWLQYMAIVKLSFQIKVLHVLIAPVSCTGRAGLEGADETVARLREEASRMRERAAEARSSLQTTHVS